MDRLTLEELLRRYGTLPTSPLPQRPRQGLGGWSLDPELAAAQPLQPPPPIRPSEIQSETSQIKPEISESFRGFLFPDTREWEKPPEPQQEESGSLPSALWSAIQAGLLPGGKPVAPAPRAPLPGLGSQAPKPSPWMETLLGGAKSPDRAEPLTLGSAGELLGRGVGKAARTASDLYTATEAGARQTAEDIITGGKEFGGGFLKGLYPTGKNDPRRQVRRGEPEAQKGTPAAPVSDIPNYSTKRSGMERDLASEEISDILGMGQRQEQGVGPLMDPLQKGQAHMQDLLGQQRTLDEMVAGARGQQVVPTGPVAGLRGLQRPVQDVLGRVTKPYFDWANRPRIGPPAIGTGPEAPRIGPPAIGEEQLAVDRRTGPSPFYLRNRALFETPAIAAPVPGMALQAPAGIPAPIAAALGAPQAPAAPANIQPPPAAAPAAPAVQAQAGPAPAPTTSGGPLPAAKKGFFQRILQPGGIYADMNQEQLQSMTALGQTGERFLRDIENSSRIGAGLPEDRSPLPPDFLESRLDRLTPEEAKMLSEATGTTVPAGTSLSRIKALSGFMEAGTRARYVAEVQKSRQRETYTERLRTSSDSMKRKLDDALGVADNVGKLLSQPSSINDKAVMQLMPRVNREVGNLSEREGRLFGSRWGPQAIVDITSRITAGQFSAGLREELKQMLGALTESIRRDKIRRGMAQARAAVAAHPDLFSYEEALGITTDGQRIIRMGKNGELFIVNAEEAQQLKDEGKNFVEVTD